MHRNYDAEMQKNSSVTTGNSISLDSLCDEHDSTYHDVRDMNRLGKKQEFMRNFGFSSIVGFTSTLMATWEAMLASSALGLVDGGTGGLIWSFAGTAFLMGTVIASMCDMASMAPTSGGQYHWVSEFAPPSSQRFLSYIVGWVSALGWQSAVASTAFLSGDMIQSLIILWKDDYVPERWHVTILTILMALLAAFFNTYGARHLPLLEGLVLCLHVFGFFAIIIPLWTLAPKQSAHDVFFSFADGGGWGSVGTACIIGMVSNIYSFIGPDAGTHMSEEIRDASRIVPRSMMATVVLNGILGFVMAVTYCFCITDLNRVLSSPIDYPFIQVFYDATNSKAATTAMTVMIAVLLEAAGISALATASRQTFAFARDEGLPFSRVWRRVVKVGTEIPLNSVILCLVITIVLAFINIGSSLAFSSVVSLLVSSLFTGYVVSISCILLKRLRGQPLPPSRWSMGRFAIPVNIIALVYCLFASTMSFFPPVRPVNGTNMNWSVAVWGAVILLAVASFLIHGRKHYKGPVVHVNKDMEVFPGRRRN